MVDWIGQSTYVIDAPSDAIFNTKREETAARKPQARRRPHLR